MKLPTIFAASGWENVQTGNGISIAITGMLIVFLALFLISLFILFLPNVLERLDPYLPKVEHYHAQTPAEKLPTDEEKIVAAIGFVLHREMQRAAKP